MKTGFPLARVKQHLIIKLKKHTNETKTFSKRAAAPRPDFMGPRRGRICVFALIGLQAKRLMGGPDAGVNRRIKPREPHEVSHPFP